jgi:hypothetical protein
MSVSQQLQDIPEYFSFIDPHLKFQVYQFYLAHNKENKNALLKEYGENLFRTLQFDLQDRFINENKEITDLPSNTERKERTTQQINDIKQKISSFLNLINNNVDLEIAHNKKNVTYLIIFIL